MTKLWKKGRGKLGPFEPLIGAWVAKSDSPQGPVTCRRTFARAAGSAVVTLTAVWEFGPKRYEELAVFAPGDDGALTFWSFTADGKRSTGHLVAAPDLHPEAIAFEAQMPAGLARQAYWPDPAGGFRWAVESRNKKGWNRFVEHHYRPA
jgi:hypothetical protein